MTWKLVALVPRGADPLPADDRRPRTADGPDVNGGQSALAAKVARYLSRYTPLSRIAAAASSISRMNGPFASV